MSGVGSEVCFVYSLKLTWTVQSLRYQGHVFSFVVHSPNISWFAGSKPDLIQRLIPRIHGSWAIGLNFPTAFPISTLCCRINLEHGSPKRALLKTLWSKKEPALEVSCWLLSMYLHTIPYTRNPEDLNFCKPKSFELQTSVIRFCVMRFGMFFCFCFFMCV